MKKIITVLLLTVASLAKSQHTSVTPPQNIQHAFTTHFVNATTVHWASLPNSNNLEAKFVDGDIPKIVHFSPEGNLLVTESTLGPTQLPSAVTQSLKSNFLGFDLGQIRKIEISNEVTFKVVVRKGSDQYEVEFELSGKIRTKQIIEAPKDTDQRGDSNQKNKHKKHKNRKYKHNHGDRHEHCDDDQGEDDDKD